MTQPARNGLRFTCIPTVLRANFTPNVRHDAATRSLPRSVVAFRELRAWPRDETPDIDVDRTDVRHNMTRSLFTLLACLLVCACSSTRREDEALALRVLYGSAVSRDECGATYYLFHMDTKRALPAFLDVVTSMQQAEVAPLPGVPERNSQEARMTMFYRASTALEDDPRGFRQVLLRWCTDPAETVRDVGIGTAREIAEDEESPRRREAARVIRELNARNVETVEQAVGGASVKAADGLH